MELGIGLAIIIVMVILILAPLKLYSIHSELVRIRKRIEIAVPTQLAPRSTGEAVPAGTSEHVDIFPPEDFLPPPR